MDCNITTPNVLLSYYFILNDKNIDGFGGNTIIFVAIILGRFVFVNGFWESVGGDQ